MDYFYIVYGSILCSCGIFFSLGFIIALYHHVNYVYAYYIYLHAVGIIGILYLMIDIQRRKITEKRRVSDNPGIESVNDGSLSATYVGELVSDDENKYLRLGLVAFGVVGCVFYCITGVASFTNDAGCYDNTRAGIMFFIAFFVALEMIFVLMHGRTTIGFYPKVVLFILVHLIATNMCNWMFSIIIEAATSYAHALAPHHGADNHEVDNHEVDNHEVDNHGVVHNHTKRSSSPSSHGNFTEHVSDMKTPIDCLAEGDLSTVIAPYLYPFVIEFNMILVAYLCKITKNMFIGPQMQNKNELTSESCKRPKVNHKCGIQTFFKIWILGFTIIPAIIYAAIVEGQFKALEDNDLIELFLYYGVNLVALVISIILTIPSLLYIRKQKYVKKSLSLDEIQLIGSYITLTVLGIFVLFGVLTETRVKDSTISQFLLIINLILSFIQTTLQMYLIGYGLKSKRNKEEKENKTIYSKRIFIKLLVYCNVGHWFLSSFMIKHISGSEGLAAYYGPLAWVIISNVLLPMSIFFRFHSGACLTEVYELTLEKE